MEKIRQAVMGSASLAAARPPARTVTTIPLQPGGLRGKNLSHWLQGDVRVIFESAIS